MQIKIKPNAGSIFVKNYYKGLSPQAVMLSVTREFADKITAIQGMTIDVETKYLWDDQFNTVPIPGVSESGLRILDFDDETSIIEEVIDDARTTRQKCPKCRNYLRDLGKPEDTCYWCGVKL
ncbi:hypothetical protein KKH23_07500 [Patescibacteria group bacterium]|nr:hypothetical protein [Patescibacteria group bacterium]